MAGRVAGRRQRPESLAGGGDPVDPDDHPTGARIGAHPTGGEVTS